MSEIQGSQPYVSNVIPIMEQEQDPLLKSRHGWELLSSLSGTFLFFSMLFIHYPAQKKGTASLPGLCFKKERFRVSGMGTAGLSVAV